MLSQPFVAAAVAAFERGDLDRARRIAETELAKSTQIPFLHHLLGLIDCRLGRLESGKARLKCASDAEPDNISFRIAYATLLVDTGRHRDALAQIDEGSRLALEQFLNADARNALTSGGGIGVPMQPDLLAVVRELGLLLDRTNQIDGLRNLLVAAKTAGLAANSFGFLAASVALRDGKPEDAKRLLLKNDGPVEDAQRFSLLTKIADTLGETEEAFAAAANMNRAAPNYHVWRRRGAYYRSQIRAIAELVTPQWASRIHPAVRNDNGPNIAFLVGFPRSGTTLLDTFLMGHPQTCVIEEGKMLELAAGALGEPPGLAWSPDLVDRARTAYLGELSRHVPSGFTGVIIDKHPLNMLRLTVAYAIFPSAKVIFAQRHPCDVVLSGFMQNFQLNYAMANFLDIADAGDFYDAAMSMWMRSHDAVPLPVHSVTYERLTEVPGSELRPALEFLGLDWNEGVLDHQVTAANRGAISTASYDQVVQPLSRAPSGRWRRYQKQLKSVLPTLLTWAERLGYKD